MNKRREIEDLPVGQVQELPVSAAIPNQQMVQALFQYYHGLISAVKISERLAQMTEWELNQLSKDRRFCQIYTKLRMEKLFSEFNASAPDITSSFIGRNSNE
jgi:hypothetical protein